MATARDLDLQRGTAALRRAVEGPEDQRLRLVGLPSRSMPEIPISAADVARALRGERIGPLDFPSFTGTVSAVEVLDPSGVVVVGERLPHPQAVDQAYGDTFTLTLNGGA